MRTKDPQIGDLLASPIVNEIGMIIAIRPYVLAGKFDFKTDPYIYDVEWYNVHNGFSTISNGVSQHSVKKWRKRYLTRRKAGYYV